MKIAVAGGTGFLGRSITRALLDAGHEVVVGSRRRPEKAPLDPRATWVAADVTAPETLPALLAGADAVVDAVQFPNSPIEHPEKGYTFERIDLGGTRNLVDAAKSAGTPLFIGLSGVGAAEHAPYHWQRFKWQEEQHIAASGVPYVVFRPSWVYGPGDVSLNRFLGFAKFLPFVPVIGNGKTRINPLYVEDLAAHVVAAVQKPEARGRIFEIGGPDVLTMDDVIRTALRVSGRRRFLLHSPKPVMKLVASVAQFAPGRPLTPDAIDFITMDGVADTAALREVFGLRLTPLEEGLAAYLKR
ncbi:complex I NDUFA9 subunit family protein [Tepidiforma bonchosmolovskayae]|uniref:Complex I NDUFA9 subunit family protein n=1 Tax=Tepidiforma bonchosmolovskayae TaxID=2601677 RepID=A0ABX6C4R2_9CHLR|nr:complex I NDUFA9 subunit family protein [Tepidiforma bonchosmolovskayae]QFG04250.1 complex I NDUFA9 subunit family protein [Tepidiforma bonchosmolovskayae]